MKLFDRGGKHRRVCLGESDFCFRCQRVEHGRLTCTYVTTGTRRLDVTLRLERRKMETDRVGREAGFSRQVIDTCGPAPEELKQDRS